MRRHANSGPTPVRISRNSPIGIISLLNQTRIEADLLAGHGFRDDREQRAPQHREAACQQDQVIEQEAGFAGDHAFQLGLALQIVEPVEDQVDGGGDADSQERRRSICRWATCAKACTELTRPERVRKVPKMHRKKVAETSTMFQTFIMPFFSCIMTECRKAVPLSQGSSEAFSTGSQPQ